jgi:hypothetical protein
MKPQPIYSGKNLNPPTACDIHGPAGRAERISRGSLMFRFLNPYGGRGKQTGFVSWNGTGAMRGSNLRSAPRWQHRRSSLPVEPKGDCRTRCAKPALRISSVENCRFDRSVTTRPPKLKTISRTK